jgi:DNA polymerase-3 subunit delta'
MNIPWFAPAQARVKAALGEHRLPHALLVHADAGAGGTEFALWVAQAMLCRERAAAPCGVCADCKWLIERQHPDCAWLTPLGESKFILIEQVRELLAELTLTSHTGRGKVAVLVPAEAMNAASANALLKTLEEPAAGTLIVLVTHQPSKLLPTLRSRCLQLRVTKPPASEAARWLIDNRGAGPWEEALRITGAGPLTLAETDPNSIVAAHREVSETLARLLDRAIEPPAVADAWARSDLDLRLACTESWITERVYARAGGKGLRPEVGAATHLPDAPKDLNIRSLIELQSVVRDLRASLSTSINKSYAVESLLWRWVQVKK